MTENFSHIENLKHLIDENELNIGIDNDIEAEELFEILVENIGEIESDEHLSSENKLNLIVCFAATIGQILYEYEESSEWEDFEYDPIISAILNVTASQEDLICKSLVKNFNNFSCDHTYDCEFDTAILLISIKERPTPKYFEVLEKFILHEIELTYRLHFYLIEAIASLDIKSSRALLNELIDPSNDRKLHSVYGNTDSDHLASTTNSLISALIAIGDSESILPILKAVALNLLYPEDFYVLTKEFRATFTISSDQMLNIKTFQATLEKSSQILLSEWII